MAGDGRGKHIRGRPAPPSPPSHSTPEDPPPYLGGNPAQTHIQQPDGARGSMEPTVVPTTRRARRSSATPVAFLLVLLLSLAGAASAQEVPAIPEDRITVYARTYRAVSALRDEMYNQLARTHDREGKERLREELDTRLAAIHEEHAMPVEEYRRITFVISVDGAQREIFDRKLAELAQATPDER